MDLGVNLRVTGTEIPNLSSIGYGVGQAPDGSAVRFYDDWPRIQELQRQLEQGQQPEIVVSLEKAILRRRHWAA
jgi:hypothetical protein